MLRRKSAMILCRLALTFLIGATEIVDMEAKSTKQNPTVVVSQPSQQELDEMGVTNWPIWSGGARKYPASYPTAEWCYFLEGELVVHTASGEKIPVKAGDLAIFEEGLKCTWVVTKAVRKHYKYNYTNE